MNRKKRIIKIIFYVSKKKCIFLVIESRFRFFVLKKFFINNIKIYIFE